MLYGFPKNIEFFEVFKADENIFKVLYLGSDRGFKENVTNFEMIIGS